jgi:hypothetical protein
MNLATVEIKAFVPARDISVSAEFYRTIGFEIPWLNESMGYVRYGSTSFLLQQFYVKEHAQNFMMHMLVESADDWYEHVMQSGAPARFGVHVAKPEDRPWGIRDFTLGDPTGVFWRIGHNL